MKGRFAPSPSGRMHAGNIFAALITWLLVKKHDGKVLLRIEDLDAERSKPEFIDAIQRDLEMLGLTWDEGPVFQHDREEAYQAAYGTLRDDGLVYPCFCTRAQIKAMRSLSSAPHVGESSFYSGRCRGLSSEARAELLERADAQGTPYSYRLATDGVNIGFDDLFQGEQHAVLDPARDDFIIRRSDGAFAYQLAVVVDDAEQGVNMVSRGIDLLESTPKQIYLQQLLGLDTPVYAHVPLLVNSEGQRLAKRDRSAALDELLCIYKTPQAIIGHIAYIGGLLPEDGESITPELLLASFDEKALRKQYRGTHSLLYGQAFPSGI